MKEECIKPKIRTNHGTTGVKKQLIDQWELKTIKAEELSKIMTTITSLERNNNQQLYKK